MDGSCNFCRNPLHTVPNQKGLQSCWTRGCKGNFEPDLTALRPRSGCPRDTNGDGNCGQPACPYCGVPEARDWRPSPPGSLDALLRTAFEAGQLSGYEGTGSFEEWRRTLRE